jgi:BCD family chlorophyll transporter-like MFS transporter
MAGPATGYLAVYGIEILLLFLTVAAFGPLVRSTRVAARSHPGSGLAGSAQI